MVMAKTAKYKMMRVKEMRMEMEMEMEIEMEMEMESGDRDGDGDGSPCLRLYCTWRWISAIRPLTVSRSHPKSRRTSQLRESGDSSRLTTLAVPQRTMIRIDGE